MVNIHGVVVYLPQENDDLTVILCMIEYLIAASVK